MCVALLHLLRRTIVLIEPFEKAWELLLKGESIHGISSHERGKSKLAQTRANTFNRVTSPDFTVKSVPKLGENEPVVIPDR